jgi:hypothetical protein
MFGNVLVYGKQQSINTVTFSLVIKIVEKHKLYSLHLTAIFYIRGCGLYYCFSSVMSVGILKVVG